MEWLISLLHDESIAHIILLYSFVIAVGVMLGKIKIFGVSRGVTFVLFTVIVVGHFGFTVNDEVLHFIREFGLILFIFSIGLQVGPGFFSSFKEGGMKLNMLAASVVLLGVATTIGLYYAFGGSIPMPMFVGILSGAVTNTPGWLRLRRLCVSCTMRVRLRNTAIALGYAVAIRWCNGYYSVADINSCYFKVSFDKENKQIQESRIVVSEAPKIIT
jgi:putative transport protein